MATTVTVVPNSATPYSVMYAVATNGVAPYLATLTGTQLLADMAAGPLRDTLIKTPTTVWDDLNAGVEDARGDLIRIYNIATGTSTCHAARTRLTWIVGANLGTCGLEVFFESFDSFESQVQAPGTITFEIRRLHSASR